jgi:O-antigen/teichoic acid export membrane protein
MLIFCTIVGLLFARQMNWIAITFTALLFAIVSGYNSILSGVQNAARRRSVVALHQGVESWLRFLFAAVLMMWLGATSATAMIGYILATILVLGSQYRFFRKIMPQNPVRVSNGEHWQKKIWTFSWPISSFGIFTWAQLASDRWALGLFSTMQEVGLYAVLFQLGYYPISLLSGMLIQFLAPIFYQRAGDASNKQRNANVAELSWRLTSITLLATSVTFLLALQFHTQIFRMLVATEYARISHLLPWIMLAGGLFAAGQNIGLNLMSQLKTRAMMSVKIVTALLGVALNFIGAYWYGITGIVTANILFSLLFFFWMLALGKKQGG